MKLRTRPLEKKDKERLTALLRELELLPPVAGAIALNINAECQVASVELQKAVWR